MEWGEVSTYSCTTRSAMLHVSRQIRTPPTTTSRQQARTRCSGAGSTILQTGRQVCTLPKATARLCSTTWQSGTRTAVVSVRIKINTCPRAASRIDTSTWTCRARSTVVNSCQICTGTRATCWCRAQAWEGCAAATVGGICAKICAYPVPADGLGVCAFSAA